MSRPEPATAWPTWLALLIATLLLTWTGTPPVGVVACLLVMAGTLLVSLRWSITPVAILVLLGVGVMLRVWAVGGGWSDVMLVTDAALHRMLDGGGPYGVGYAESIPPGAPFAYGPMALLWYLPAIGSPGRLELGLSLALLGVLALRGRPLGLAIYATLPALLVTATDGSNDTSAGVLILLALLAAQRSPMTGGVLLAFAVAFKPYALAWLLPLLAYAGSLLPLVAFAGASLLTWGWAAIAWGVSPILSSIGHAESVHDQPYYSAAWVVPAPLRPPEWVWSVGRYTAGAIVAVVGWRWVRTGRSFVVVGCGVFLATLFLGWWSTFAYLAAIAPVVCWHLDDWLGTSELRVRWPADPIGRMTRWLDGRWPILRPWAQGPPRLP